MRETMKPPIGSRGRIVAVPSTTEEGLIMALRQRLIRWHKSLVSIGAEASSNDSCREIGLLANEAALAVGRLMDDLEHNTERAVAMEGSGEAVQPHHELRRPGSDSSIVLKALDQLSVAVVITEGDGRVIEMNLAAEHIFQLGDGLLIRNGRLCSRRAFESTKLTMLIAAAAAEKAGEAQGRMTIGRAAGRPDYLITVASLGMGLAVHGRPLAAVLVAVPDGPPPSERDLAEFFGLSPAESRLAAALMTGEKLNDIAPRFGLQITTLRTELSTVLRKLGVKRQADLARLLSTVRVFNARPRDS